MVSPAKNGNLRQIISAAWMRLMLLMLLFAVPGSVKLSPSVDDYIVVIDPGHGGRDPGALGSSSREKDIVLAIALKAGNYIKQNYPEVKVLFTRDKDVFVELYKRPEFANKNHADLFISIHANSVGKNVSRNVAGSETFVLGNDPENKNLEVVMKENEVILLEEDYSTRYQGYDPSSPESYIMFSLIQNVYQKQSIEFATMVQEQFRERVGRIDRGVKQGGLWVLKNTTMPSVLVEVGFISNTSEEKFMKSEQGQDYLASAIFRAFREYKTGIDKGSSISTVREEATAKTVTPDDKILFTVQIATTKEKKQLDPLVFKGLTDLVEFVSPDRYRYASGRFADYQEAVAYRKKIAEKFPDAFVIAFRGTSIIPLPQAIEATKKR